VGAEYLSQILEAMRPVVPVLIKSLSDEDSRVARSAAYVLGEMTLEPDLVVPALLKSLDYPYPDKYGYVRLAAIEALGNFGEAAQSAVPALTKLAQSDPLGYVGGTFAASALKEINPQKK
jgi:HEAT repeat protein